MSTPIFVSKKLEKLIKKYITTTPEKESAGILGKWNATVFYTQGRENWLLYNPKTHYSVILENIEARDLLNIREKIGEELELQLVIDGIEITSEQRNWLLDEISFHPTDGDRSTTAYMNQILYLIPYYQRPEFYISLAGVNAVLNDSVFSLDGYSKFTSITKPRLEMEKILRLYLSTNPVRPTPPSQLN
jgi:hypothetical protein